MNIFLDQLLDSLIDTLYIVPILYLAYLLVSYFSHNDNEKYSKILHKTRKAGPAIGAFLGCIPQCGFSSLMSQLYSKKIITFGTLIAVFIATSDEAIPLMIARPEFIPNLLILIAIKVVYAILIGYILDGTYRLITRKKPKLNDYHDIHEHTEVITNSDNNQTFKEELTESQHEEFHIQEEHHHESKFKCHHAHEEEHGHDHTHGHCCATNIFLDALQHTAIIVAYVFVATLIINLIKGYAGGLEPLQKFFSNNVYLQILLSCLIGLIPNCASSVFLVELYMEGVLLFPALVAGLSAGAGIGLIVLYTTNYKKVGVNIFITVLLYVLAFIIGIITNFIPIW